MIIKLFYYIKFAILLHSYSFIIGVFMKKIILMSLFSLNLLGSQQDLFLLQRRINIVQQRVDQLVKYAEGSDAQKDHNDAFLRLLTEEQELAKINDKVDKMIPVFNERIEFARLVCSISRSDFNEIKNEIEEDKNKCYYLARQSSDIQEEISTFFKNFNEDTQAVVNADISSDIQFDIKLEQDLSGFTFSDDDQG